MARGKEVDNNFDLLRHVAATLVLWFHAFSLSAGRNDPLAGTPFDGALGVNIFFAISGFLITESWIRRSNALAFAEARMLRIMPALLASVGLCAFVIGPALSRASLTEYLFDWHLRWFVLGNASLLWMEEELPQLFLTNPHPAIVNGSLWTLPKEATMYGLVLGIGLLCRSKLLSRAFIPLLCVAFAIASWRFIQLEQSEHALSLARVSRYFIAGAIIGSLSDSARGPAIVAACLLASLVAAPLPKAIQAIAIPIALASAVLACARIRLPTAVGGRWPVDLSYGLYIYGYPLQQVLFQFWPQLDGYHMFAISLPLTGLVAIASWHFVEKPALAKKGQFAAWLRPRVAV